LFDELNKENSLTTAATNINKGLPVALALALAVFALSLLPAAFPASLELSGESAKAVASLDVNSP
jgi:hypothetical protein